MATLEIVLIDDESANLDLQVEYLKTVGLSAKPFTDPLEAWAYIQNPGARLVITDWEMPKMSGLEVLFKIRGLERPPPIIIATGHGTVDRAVQALVQGASNFLEKPLSMDRYLSAVKEVLAAATGIQTTQAAISGARAAMAGERPLLLSSGMREVFAMAKAAASSDANVLLLGESGTGKEVLADYIHANSGRSSGPLVKVNCGALPEHLIESELFGHEKGAFTGADRRRIGRFEHAAGGTLFLDEVGELLLPLQVKLLRALQERVIERVGSETNVPVNFRLVSATNRDLKDATASGKFREDLYYRINVVPIRLPPLRQRVEDVEPLARYFFQDLRRHLPEGPRDLSPDAIARLKRFAWPGNVRQLRNAIEYALVMCRTPQVMPRDLPQDVQCMDSQGTREPQPAERPTEHQAGPGEPGALPNAPEPLLARLAKEFPIQPLEETVRKVESEVIRSALERHQGNIDSILQELKISRSRLYERMKEYGLRRPD